MTADMSKRSINSDFPCSLIIKTPFPTHHLATTALQALQVDAELSPLVSRTFSLITPPSSPPSSPLSKTDSSQATATAAHPNPSTSPSAYLDSDSNSNSTGQTVLLTEYRAKTNRMLRVAVNGFMESLGLVLGVMEKLDVDVLAQRDRAKRDSAAAAMANGDAAGMATTRNL